MSTEKSKVIDWIQQAVGSTTSKIEFEGKSLSGEGYLAQLCLVKVTLDAGEVLNLIVKIGKKDEELRKKTQVFREFCSREIYFYDKIIPAFQQFAALKNIRQPFEAFPKVYKTFLDDENEVIVMDNLKILGFELHPPQTSLNVEHTKVVLKNYAKLHASSLAMQVQDKDNFDKITENYVTPLLDFWNFHKPVVDANSVKLLEVLKEIGRDDLADKFEKKFMEKGVYSHITDVVKNTPATKAILHCDCHNNNYLFKYENEDDKSIPSDMVIIDYQASSLHSPMLDLGIFFYMTQSKTEFAQFKELMEHYHKELSSYLTEVRCDPDKVYPMSLLWSDWKKYSTYGFLIASTLFELLFIAKEEAPTMEGGDEGFMQVKLKYKDEYHDRLTGVLEHYFNFQNL